MNVDKVLERDSKLSQLDDRAGIQSLILITLSNAFTSIFLFSKMLYKWVLLNLNKVLAR